MKYFDVATILNDRIQPRSQGFSSSRPPGAREERGREDKDPGNEVEPTLPLKHILHDSKWPPRIKIFPDEAIERPVIEL